MSHESFFIPIESHQKPRQKILHFFSHLHSPKTTLLTTHLRPCGGCGAGIETIDAESRDQRAEIREQKLIDRIHGDGVQFQDTRQTACLAVEHSMCRTDSLQLKVFGVVHPLKVIQIDSHAAVQSQVTGELTRVQMILACHL